MISRKFYYFNGWPYLEYLRQIGPDHFERQRHTPDPRARAYKLDLSLEEKMLWDNSPFPTFDASANSL